MNVKKFTNLSYGFLCLVLGDALMFSGASLSAFIFYGIGAIVLISALFFCPREVE